MLDRHPLLREFKLNTNRLRSAITLCNTTLGQQALQILQSRDCFSALMGAIDAAPSRSPLPALDRYLCKLPPEIMQDQYKQLIGRYVIQMIEHIGGKQIRPGTPVTVGSMFTSGSIYNLPTTRRVTRGKTKPSIRGMMIMREQMMGNSTRP